MTNTLGELIEEFIEYKHRNGYTYETAGYHLQKYKKFSINVSPNELVPSKYTINTFLNQYIQTPGNLYNIAATLREFSRYLIGLGYHKAYVIPPKKVSLPTPVQPYLFTQDEIDAFFKQCDQIQPYVYLKTRHLVLPALYRLHYCCGLRCKETRTLLRENVHLDLGYIDIIQSKGPKSRRLFISDELIQYLNKYDQEVDLILYKRKFFFPIKGDKPYSASAFSDNFLNIWYKAFPEKKDDGVSVRAYDFRHHFAYANMNRWLKEEKDVNAMLPYLMKYMGHQDIENTLYYFHLVPDIYDTIVRKSSSFESLLPEVKFYE